MANVIPWSYSSLTSFETCPRKHYFIKIAKAVPDPPGEAAIWGNEGHKHLENRVKVGAPLPKAYAHCEKYVRTMEGVGTLQAEAQMCINKSFEPVGWFDKAGWARGIVDVHTVDDKRAIAWDWKFGKVKPDSDQLKLFAALMFHHYPQIQRVKTGFVWLAHQTITKDIFTRNQIQSIWSDFYPRVTRLEIALEKDKWPPKPSGLCKAWCNVGKSLCEFCGRA